MKILLTGAGGAAAVSVWKSLHGNQEIVMADIDPCAAGLYLVPPEQRIIIPKGDSEGYVPFLLQLCQQKGIDLLIPTVDCELLPIAKALPQFEELGIKVPLCSVETLTLCRDKLKLFEFCKELGVTSPFHRLTKSFMENNIEFPCFAKPRLGSGSAGAMVIHNKQDLLNLPDDGRYLIQELLPGEEYSVDVYIQSNGMPLASVPRFRMKIDSGIAVAAQTKIIPELSQMALEVAKKINIRYVANIQFKQNRQGEFKLLEINPRFPGTLPLTSAAGIDIPKLLIQNIQGKLLPGNILPFKEMMVVRYWTEQFFEIEEWQKLCPL